MHIYINTYTYTYVPLYICTYAHYTTHTHICKDWESKRNKQYYISAGVCERVMTLLIKIKND